MIAAQSPHHLTPEDYLAQERHSEIKHEYINGEVYAMAGTTKTHNTISLNTAMLLRMGLRSSQCETFMADVKVGFVNNTRFFYPDLVVTCDSEDDSDPDIIRSPKLIIEVLSKSTEAYDRGKKFQDYRTLPSLQEYVLISSQEYLVDVFRRAENNLWLLQSYQGEDAIAQFQSINIDAPLAEIYATVDPGEPPDRPDDTPPS
ncbi:Uma2 family endonuclease [Spirulina major]|uniref:Uma2 family endonuclease n=1 Tax=Spirulina major TaxID=270636 RepID=UPI00093391E7|nr:Uma2 family endonuclease [Spirulina major]